LRTGGTAVIPISYKSGLLWGTGEAGSYMTQRMYLALETDFWRHLLLWLRCLRVFLVAGAGTRRRRGQRGSVNPSGRVGKLGTHTPAHTLHTQLPKQVALKAVLRRGILGGTAAQRHGLSCCWTVRVDRVLLGAAKTRCWEGGSARALAAGGAQTHRHPISRK